MRCVIFDELRHDRPASFGVFLADVVSTLDAHGVEVRLVSPGWPIPGTRADWLHGAIAAVWRQIVYPVAAIWHFERQSINFLISSGLAHLLWFAPRRARVVMFCHDVFPFLTDDQLGHRLDFGGRWRQAFLSVVHKPAFRRADLIIVPSDVTRRDLIRTTGVDPAKVVRLAHRIDPARFAPGDREAARRRLGWPTAAPVALVIASPERRKNIEAAIDGIAAARQRLPELRLAIVGTLSRAQERRLAERGLSGAVIRGVHLEPDAVPDWYRAANCLVHLSYYEGFGYPPAEAMACGCPVVCAPGGAVEEVVGDAAEWIAPVTPDRVADGVVRVVTDGARAAELRQRGFARARQFAAAVPYVEAIVGAR